MSTHHPMLELISAFVCGGGLVRVLVYISKAMPPLSDKAGWWTQFFYQLMKNTSGLDPSSAILSQKTLAEITGGKS